VPQTQQPQKQILLIKEEETTKAGNNSSKVCFGPKTVNNGISKPG